MCMCECACVFMHVIMFANMYVCSKQSNLRTRLVFKDDGKRAKTERETGKDIQTSDEYVCMYVYIYIYICMYVCVENSRHLDI
jgi:hypothetical protein